jgi:two-component system LytT family response regulator
MSPKEHAVEQTKTLIIKTLIVDDESPARKRMRQLLLAHPEILVIGEASDVDEGLELERKHRPDLIFLDVQMKPENGFALLNKLPQRDRPPAIVFVTAHDQYAVKAFEHEALDYLTKPVFAERLARSIQRLKPRGTPNAPRRPAAPQTGSAEPAATLAPQDLVLLKDGERSHMAKVVDIRVVEATGHFTRIALEGSQFFVVHRPISYWETRLPKLLFQRISRSLLINRSQVLSFKTVTDNRTHAFLKGLTKPVELSRLEAYRLRHFLNDSRDPMTEVG